MYVTDLADVCGADYEIVACDPPWSYKDKATAGNRGAEFKYPCLSLADLKALPVQDIIAKDCVLFMWTTGPMLVDDTAGQLARAWGFTPKTMAFTWVKTTRLGKEWFWGMGRWTRANPEYVTLCTRGNPSRVSAAVHSVIKSPIQQHSVKPAEYRDRIVQLMGDVPRIELFARGEPGCGFDGWGNEPAGPQTLPDYVDKAREQNVTHVPHSG